MNTEDRRIAWAAALITLTLHLLANPHYGFFRDELYFIICGQHPDWGYVDQPPLIPLFAAGSQLFGHSLFLLRAVAALCGAGSVFVTVRIVQQLGGARFAQILGACVAALTPVLIAFAGKVGPDAIELWMWPLAALYVLRLVDGADPRTWLGVGAAFGVAGEGKYSILFFAIALLVGIMLTAQRRIFATPWFLAGMGLAAIIVLPNFIWQWSHGFPMLELLTNGQQGKNLIVSPLEYLVQQVFIVNPLFAPIYIAGIIWSFMQARTRWIGWSWVVLIGLMIVLHGKHYYPGSIYALIAAPAALAIEAWTRRLPVLRQATIALVLIASAWMIPFVEPILSESQFIAYKAAIASVIPMNLATERQREPRMISDWADMHGWPELAQAVGQVYDALPREQRAQAVVFASNYGEASAVAFFRPDIPVISGHNQYWVWGTRGYSGNVIIDLNGDCGADAHLFEHATRAATFANPLGMPYEDGIPVMLCRGIKKPLATIWPAVKKYI